MARGNFQVSAEWENGRATEISILSNKGELCRLKYMDLSDAKITDAHGKNIKFKTINSNLIEFKTKQGMTYYVKF